MPIRIQRKRIKGWRMPDNAASVTRPGFYGNPFKVGSDASSEYAIQAYRQWLTDTPEGRFTVEKAKKELLGKDLACWCKIGDPCHADILLEIVNTPPNEPEKEP